MLLGPPGAPLPPPRARRRADAARSADPGGGLCRLGLVPALLLAPLSRLAPWQAPVPAALVLRAPGTGSLPTLGIALLLAGFSGAFLLLRGRRVAAPSPTWACGQLATPELLWTSAGFTKPLRLVLEVVLRPQRQITSRSEGGVCRRSATAAASLSCSTSG